MKKYWIIISVFTLLFIGATSAMSSSGGDFEISFYSIDGGGGASSGGIYQVMGTIGQHDAHASLSGGEYTLSGGFWGGGFFDFLNFLPLVIK